MHEDNDATRVAPVGAARRDHDDDRTIVKPVSDAPSTRTGTGTQSGSVGTSEAWERLATLAPGESPTVGTVLKGRFFLERELGRGGMGVVFLARDERKVEARDRDPYVAVKVLNDQFRKHPDSLIALQREARRAQQFANDHIVRVYDFDKDGSNVFMTMEYVEGSDLRALMRSRGRDGLPFAEAWPLIEGMAAALQRAHEAGVVHSDFKPGNVMVTAAGVAKVFDFGIARAGHLAHDGNVPRNGHDDETVFDAGTLGAMTPAYASLAMLRGEPPAPADDVYAFGCVVAELLTGRHPFAKKTAEEALSAGLKPPVVPGLDKRQQKALADALALTAERRTADIATVLAGLRRRRLRERATPWVAAAVVAGVVATGGAWYASHRAEQQHVADTLRRFDPGQPDAFTGEDQVRQGLGSLTGDERRRVVVDGADTIDGFLVRQLAAHWDPAKGRLDYAGAERTFALRAELKTFAPKFDRRRDEVVHEREDQLNRLDTALSEAILAGRLFGDSADDVPAILGRIRSVDPTSRLLANPELELKFGMAIEASQKQGDTAAAEKQLAIASTWFPASSRLAAIAATLKGPVPATSAAMPVPLPAQDGTDLAVAERTSRLESLRHASAAGDLDKALASYRALNAGATAPPPADDEAAGLLAQAALAAARNACAAGHWKDAAASVQTALDATGERTDLRRAKTRYDLAVAVMNAAKAPSLTDAEQDDLSKRLQAARQDDAAGMKDMEAAMVASKSLPEG
ncbi:MAG: serine/threonine-protein kinase, partial [Luteibacter jiangsuensis]